MSDSFVINTKDDSDKSLVELLEIIKRICEQEFAQNGILLRGGIAKGEFDKLEAKELSTLKKGLIIGQAYVEAYLLEGSVKLAGISLSKEVHEDIDKVAAFNSDIFKETKDGKEIYIFRCLTAEFLMNQNNLKTFVRLAIEAKWRPHYYNAIYFAIKGKKSNIDYIFSNIINEIKISAVDNNWSEIDAFIKGAFNNDVIYDFQKRFLGYLRRNLL